jgi:hypothetical protein
VAPSQHPLSALGPEFTAAGLPDQIHGLLPAPGGVQSHTAPRQNGTAPSEDLPPDCIQRAVTGHQGEPPLLTAHGGYQGAPVTVYVYRLAADPSRLDVFLLAPGCTTAPATVLLQQQIPAH